MHSLNFKGVFPVLPTPLDEKERVDVVALDELVEYYIESGCHGLVILGSGGEYPYLSFDEKVNVMTCAVKACQGRVPVVASTSCMGTGETIALSKKAQEIGIDGLLLALPTYYPIKFQGVLFNYKKILHEIQLPIMYYHFPQVTGLFLSSDEVGEICNLEGIVGIKESSLNMKEIKLHLKKIQNKQFSLLAGSSYLLTDVLRIGGAGVICPIVGIIPKDVVECFKQYISGNIKQADVIQKRILQTLPLMNTFSIPISLQKYGLNIMSRLPFSFKGGNQSRHAVIKATLSQMGFKITPKVKSPLPQITEYEIKEIKQLIERLDIKRRR